MAERDLSVELVQLFAGNMSIAGKIHKCRFVAEGKMLQLHHGMLVAGVQPTDLSGHPFLQKLLLDAQALRNEATRLDQVIIYYTALLAYLGQSYRILCIIPHIVISGAVACCLSAR
jgi:hypothetical protein